MGRAEPAVYLPTLTELLDLADRNILIFNHRDVPANGCGLFRAVK